MKNSAIRYMKKHHVRSLGSHYIDQSARPGGRSQTIITPVFAEQAAEKSR